MQHLSPLEIQKQTFAKSMKGYAVDEVRGYLQMVAEEIEGLLKDIDRATRENGRFREELAEYTDRERILKDTLLSAQKVSEEVKENARKEAELIVRDAEMLSERMIRQAMDRVGELERSIQDLKIERKAARNKLSALVETFQQLIMMDAEQEANEFPVTQLYRRTRENG